MRLQLEKQVAQQWLRLPIFVLKASLEIEALIYLAPALRLPRQPPSALFSRNFSTGVPLLLRERRTMGDRSVTLWPCWPFQRLTISRVATGLRRKAARKSARQLARLAPPS